MYKIYSLKDPDTKEIKYIGITKNSLEKRLVSHLHEAFYRNRIDKGKSNWVKELLISRKLPIIEILEETEDKTREKYYINLYEPYFNLFHNKFVFRDTGIPVYCYDLQGNFIKEYPSATQAALELNLENTNIGSVVLGKRKQCGGYMWRSFQIEKIPPYRKNIIMKEVHMYSKEGLYIRSYPSARHIEGFSYKYICKCCQGKAKKYKDYRFSYNKEDKI